RHARLSHHQLSFANAKAITNINRLLEQSFRRKVLAKHPVGQIHIRQFVFPKLIMLGRISIDCFALATVYGQVRLPVAIEIKHAQHKRPIERLFKDTSRDGLAMPRDDAGQGDVKRYEFHSDDAEDEYTLVDESTDSAFTLVANLTVRSWPPCSASS